ncbi:bromodomain adjacent to zinc finger domain protein 2B-like isoform X3 [Megalops cyprinoides]|uniref:bromodomain adjacent to zinc finger domain protein 2B-like isoform X3 n=1 Tax=Megalops cyprinoides TaxID=118141 RepID=UPI0018651928|nr:bromodomain adjacent to zinc finger domain protein 2B-like isoform X3 [Megalops cyprinoides]
MESGEQLASSSSSSSASPSAHAASRSSAVSPAPPAAKSPLVSSQTPLGSPLTTCGHLFRQASDQTFSMSAVSSAFPTVSHPAFGLYTTNAGRSEFGGLGTLGVSAALAAHPQLGAFPEWWRAAEAHGRGAASFFPSLLGLPPMFATTLQNHESDPYQTRTTSKNGQGPQKGGNSAVNGNSVSASSRGSSSSTVSPALGTPGQAKAASSNSRGRKSNQDNGKAQDKPTQKTKDKKLCKKAAGSSSNSESESGSSSDTSSDGASSSGSEDLEEDDDDDEEDQSNESEDSDSDGEARGSRKEKVVTQGAGERRKDCPKSAEDQESRERKSSQPQSFPTEPPVLSRCPSQPSPQGTKPRDEATPHLSVIQSTGLVPVTKPPPTQPGGEGSPKAPPPSAKPLSLCPSPNPLPLSLSPSPKPPSLSPVAKPKSLAPSPKPLVLSTLPDEPLSHISDFRLKPPFLPQEKFQQAFPLQLKRPQESPKAHKKAALSSLPPPKLYPEAPHNNHVHPFLLGYRPPNGVIQSMVQDAPLALITKPRGQARTPDKPPLLVPGPTPASSAPVNLSTGSRSLSASSTSPTPPRRSRMPKATPPGKATPPVKATSQSHLARSLVDLFRGAESDIPGSRHSDDSIEEEDDEDEEEEDEDSDDSLSESESNLESDSDISEDDVKDGDGTGTDTDGERTPPKLTKSTSLLNTSSGLSPSCSPLNLMKTPGPASSAAVTSSGSLAYHSAPSSSYALCTPPGAGKRKRELDERELRLPLQFGWQRETRIRNLGGRLQGNVAYYAPSGKKLRQYPDVVKYLSRNGISDLTRDNFSFSAKIRVGDFYEARDGPQGVQWSLLREEEVIPRLLAMEVRRGRPPNSERQQSGDDSSPRGRRRKGRPPNVGEGELPSTASAKLLRKLEAQEIARQAAEIKLMRKLERQALARAAKEARKQQAIMAAEEKRKQKEQIKILKQQEKIKRIQQIRMEKELRAQQILEAKRKKKEEAANAKILEAEKRIKEKEMRRQQAVILKHQELERHRLDMERERRRQHMMLMKAMEARKKAEERERLKQEKRDEKRLNKERKLELKRLEVEIAREMKKPNEDMCLADHKPLPELSRVTGLVLPDGSFSDCLMVMQFLRSFGKVLGFDVSVDVPSLGVLQEGLLNVGESMGEVQDLLVRMLSAVVCDPGLPPVHRTKTALGDHLTNVGINRDNVSEILQIYMEAHCGGTELAELTESLKTKAFQAHTPGQKASILAFLVNELACSKSVVSEIDKNIDHMTNLRRDKWTIEGKLRKLRSVHAKRTGKRDTGVAGEETQALGTPASGRKRKRKGGDSDEDEDEDSDEQGDEDEDEEEEAVKRGKKGDACEDEDEGDQAASVEELEKQIEKMTKQQSQIRRKLFEASHSLRSMPFGQDRYKRRFWVLPQCGGVFVEGMENAEGPEEAEKERERGRSAEAVQVKEEVPEENMDISLDVSVEGEAGAPDEAKEKDPPNLFLQKPGSFSKLSQLLEVAKMSPEQDGQPQKQNGGSAAASPPATSPAPHGDSQTPLPSSPQPAPTQPGVGATPDPAAPLPGLPPLFPGDQLLRVLTEKSGHWFSLLPRSPCDDSSLTSAPTPPAASPNPASARPKSPSSSPTHLATSASSSPHNAMGLNNFALSALQLKPGMNLMGLPFCGWPSGLMNPNLPFSGGSLTPVLGLGYPSVEGNGNPFLAPSISTSKSESPVPPSEKPPSAASPAVEVPKPQDYPSPQPIPEEMLVGWWKVADVEELRSLVKALHCRGVREKVLQKQIQKYMEYIVQACAKNRDASAIDVTDMEENQVTAETVESWCVEEQAMEMDIAVLQQVEELERKVTSASLQVKGWIYPEPQSEREDLVYHEHKPVTKQGVAGERDAGPEREGAESGGVARRVNNPLDIAVTRLADLERNIERRYLKTPLGTTIQIKLDNVGTVTVPAPAPSNSEEGDGGEEEAAPGMKVWRKALSEVRSSAQLALCLQQLQKSIAWERSIMKVYCQICRKGDNEELLLLCDGCDKGCHTYCHKPRISSIPEGDWFCPACISKASGQSPKNKKQPNKTGAGGTGGGAAGGAGGAAGGAAGGKKSSDAKRSKKPPAVGEVSEDDSASASGTPKKGAKEAKKKKGEESPSVNPPRQESPAGGKTTPRDNSRDLALCSTLLSELEGHQDAWPFLTPVNPKSVPGYKKVIKKPMDFSTIREKLCCNHYQNLETFIIDVNLVFDNCEKFNEDNSDIGRAGHNMRKFFEKRWTDLLKTS